MAIKPQVAALLDKKMDRTDFIKHVAVGILAFSGIAGALRTLGVSQPNSSAQSYGGSAYGGSKQD